MYLMRRGFDLTQNKKKTGYCMDCGGPIMGWTTSRGKNRCGKCYLQWRRRLRFKEELEILVGQVGWPLILEMDQ